ncbi:fumarylacetoacetate hydrolase family protein [Clostridiaceae bacterium HSG29]|nr:fumarylacetoacetate hydrolase family protein [Clostridiaceae bacterium HSG29]
MKIIKFIENGIKYFGVVNNKNEVVKIDYDNIFDIIDDIENLKTQDLFINKKLYKMDSLSILAPIEYPRRNLFCIGKNYVEHAKELEGKTTKEIEGIPENPIYFSKMAYPAIGHNKEIKLHLDVTNEVDYEVELGVIIGKKCSNVDEENVNKYIFGYTIINDVTARDLQRTHFQWLRGKSLDTFCPMGPIIVTADEIENHGSLNLLLSVNGEIRQNSNTSKMIFRIEHIISELSKGITLMPGDIIASGTPEGVGMGFVPPKFLKEGDEVVCKIEHIGELRNILVK